MERSWSGVSILQRIDTWMKGISALAVIFAGLLLVVIALAMSSDVVGRALFNKPLSGLTEFVELAMVPLVFLAFSWSARRDAHIQVDLLTQFVRGRSLTILLSAGRILSTIILLWLAYISFSATFESYLSNEVHYNLKTLTYWPFRLSLAIGFMLFGLEVLLREIKSHVRSSAIINSPDTHQDGNG